MDSDNDEFYDYYDQEAFKLLELENLIIKDLDATLMFKEELERYVYDNYLPFLKYFDMARLRDIFL